MIKRPAWNVLEEKIADGIDYMKKKKKKSGAARRNQKGVEW